MESQFSVSMLWVMAKKQSAADDADGPGQAGFARFVKRTEEIVVQSQKVGSTHRRRRTRQTPVKRIKLRTMKLTWLLLEAAPMLRFRLTQGGMDADWVQKESPKNRAGDARLPCRLKQTSTSSVSFQKQPSTQSAEVLSSEVYAIPVSRGGLRFGF